MTPTEFSVRFSLGKLFRLEFSSLCVILGVKVMNQDFPYEAEDFYTVGEQLGAVHT